MHSRAISLFALAILGMAHAAPAPFARPEQSEQPPVLLSGWLSEQRLPDRPSVIARQVDYQAAAKALGIQNPPAVNFRTHFLFVHISDRYYGDVQCEVNADGELSEPLAPHAGGMRQLKLGGLSGELSGPRYLIKSFPRSAVKTVNGSPLPKR